MKVLDNILFRLWQIGELKQNDDFPDSRVSKDNTHMSVYYKYHVLIGDIHDKITDASNACRFACDYYCPESLPTDICRFLIDKGYTVSENKVVMSKTDSETIYGYKYVISWRI